MFLEINGIKKHYGEGESRVEVLNGIDIEVNKGEIVVLFGPSGSGKSTLLNIIGGIDDADEGYISIDGEKTADMNEKRLTQYRRKHAVEQRSDSGSTDANAPVTQYIEPCQRCSYHCACSGYGTWSVLYYEAAQGCQG